MEEFCDDPFRTKMLAAMIKQIVDYESPISYDLVFARIKDSCGITKDSPKIRERIKYLMDYNKIKPVPSGNKVFFWKIGDNPMAYDFYRVSPEGEVRSPEDIHPSEAACAMLEAIKEQFGIPRDAALVAGAHKLGLTRMTPAAKTLMETAMEILENENAVTLDNNGMLQVKSMI